MSIYKTYSIDQLENIASNYLIDRWSYSCVDKFSSHEKAFEKRYIYNEKSKSSIRSIAGKAYHYALQWFFINLKDGIEQNLASSEILAFNFIDEFPANEWKIAEEDDNIEEYQIEAGKIANKLLFNFHSEIKTYIDYIDEVLFVEMLFEEYLTINGQDIPLPCMGFIDLIFRHKNGSIIITDHKSKIKYTPEKEIKLSIGKQAVTYYKGLLSKEGIEADEVWFMENKDSKNKNGTPQIQPAKVKLDRDTIRIYEALLYEPLRRMLSAVSDPDYVYLINNADNMEDKAEIYDFWIKTMIAEVHEFNITERNKPLIEKRLKKIRDVELGTVDPKVIKEFRKNASEFIQYDLSQLDMKPNEKIENILRHKNIMAKVAHSFNGYSSDTYLLEFGATVNINSIYKHRLDIASALDVPNIRISRNLIMYDGRSYLALDHAKKRDKDLFWDAKYTVDMKVPLGIDNMNNVISWDMANESTANTLICGSVGSGKSVEIFSIIESVKLIKEVKKIVILDPKHEFIRYGTDENISVYNDILDIEKATAELVDEMNYKIKNGIKEYSLIIIDEYADILLQSRKGKDLDIWEDVEVGFYKMSSEALIAGATPQPKIQRQKTGELKSFEENFMSLSQKGRSSGNRIVIATQRASAKVVNGDIKINYPVQVCFRLPKKKDSEVVLDETGAEILAGAGDGLIKSPEYPDIIRFQAFYKPN